MCARLEDKKVVFLLTVVLVAFAVIPANADPLLWGNQIEVTVRYPDLDQVHTGPVVATVGPEMEFRSWAGYNIDLTDTTITLTRLVPGYWTPDYAFNGISFFDSSSVFTSVTIQSTNMGQRTPDRLSITSSGHQININFVGITTDSPDYVTLNVTGGPTPVPEPVPEPGTLMLLASGLLGTARLLRRRI